MSALFYIVLGLAIAVGGLKTWDAIWSFRAQTLADYAEADTPALKDVLGRTFQAEGVIYDFTGRVKSRFNARIVGAFDDAGGTLNEEFVYASGAVDRREWSIRFLPDGQGFTATAPDVIGEGEGKITGDAIRMTYRLQLPERAGGHVLNVVDWLYLLPDGSIVNRSEMRKFGFKAAELVATFRPVAAPAGAPGQ